MDRWRQRGREKAAAAVIPVDYLERETLGC